MDQKDLEDGEVIDGESDEELSVLKIVPPDRFKNFNWEQNTQEFERDCVKYKNRQKRSSFSSNSSLGRFIQSYEITSPPWTILWFRILRIFSVENIDRFGVFTLQT